MQVDLIDKNSSDLQNLICKVDDKLALFGKNKWLIMSYDIDKYFDKSTVLDLVFYKKILQKRVFNCEYANCVSTDDIIKKVTLLLNK